MTKARNLGYRAEILQKIGRMYPLYSGNFRLINSRALRLFTRDDPQDVWCEGPGGPMLVPLSDAVGKCIYYTGDYDRKITWLCRRLLKQGDTALDIGANLGVVALTMAKIVGASGTVHAFEPNPNMQRLIEASRARSGYANPKLHKIALGAEKGELDLFIPPSNFGAASFVKRQHHFGTTRCAVETLSDVLNREGTTAIRLIKIDVEGFENEVLRGAVSVISRLRPDAIIMETSDIAGCSFRNRPPIVTLLRFDYRLFAIPRALLSMRVEEIDINRTDAPSHDVLAVAEEKRDQIMSLLS
jgi:FkbM family methyltransferase